MKDLRDIPKRVLKTPAVFPVAHMDEVLREALVIPDAETFLKEPSVPVDWRQPQERRDERRDRERREDASKMPVASAVPPPSARPDAEDGADSERDEQPSPSSDGPSPNTNALPPGALPGLEEH